MTTTQQQIAPAITADDEDSIREWANVTEASVDADGDVWIEGPCVGHWLSAERKAQYLEWRAAQSLSPNHPNHLSPDDHLRAQIDRLRVQLTGTGGGAWRNVLADCANALAECIGRDDPRWKVVERANRLLDDRYSRAAARLQGETTVPMRLTTSMVEMSSTGRQKMATGKVIINGKSVDFDAAVNLMDDEIRERLHSTVADYDQDDPKSYQNFVNAYCVAHAEKFGEDFQVA